MASIKTWDGEYMGSRPCKKLVVSIMLFDFSVNFISLSISIGQRLRVNSVFPSKKITMIKFGSSRYL